MTDALPPPFRVDQQTITAVLDRLDAQTAPPASLDLRRAERYPYRPVTQVTLPAAFGSTRHAIAARNVSRDGVGFLTRQFVYPGTPCQVTLVTPHGRTEVVPGRVVRCRYLAGSGPLYEAAAEFEHAIDVTAFAPRARRIRVLLVHDAVAMHHLVGGFLESLNAHLVCLAAATEALSAALLGEFDAILIDLESAAFDAFEIARRLRTAGYVGPIVGLAIDTGVPLRVRCTEAGLTGYLPKPITRDSLRGLMLSLADEPLTSSLARDPAVAPLIDRFVAGLRDRVQQLSLAMESGDLAALDRLARQLRAEGGSYGFDAITDAAAGLQAAIARHESKEQTRTALSSTSELRAALHDLMHVCLRARPATCTPPIPPPAGL